MYCIYSTIYISFNDIYIIWTNQFPGRYNVSTLFLGEINRATRSFMLGESQKQNNKLCSYLKRDSDPRKIALKLPSNNFLFYLLLFTIYSRYLKGEIGKWDEN
jgi:hypothetical protein